MGWSEPKKFGTQKYDLGTSTSTWDIPALIESGVLPKNIDFEKLTTENFIAGIVKGASKATANGYQTATANAVNAAAMGFTFSYSYDDSTGVLTASGVTQSVRLRDAANSNAIIKSTSQSMTAQAWLVY